MLAGVLGAQAFSLGNLAAVDGGVRESMAAMGGAYYLGCHPGNPGMALSLLLTVGVSLDTSPAAEEDRAGYVEGCHADCVVRPGPPPDECPVLEVRIERSSVTTTHTWTEV